MEFKDGWQQSGSLFIQQAGRVQLAADFTRSKYGAGTYTAQLAINQTPNIAGANPDATATLIWKVEGNQIVRKVSVGNGVSVTGTGQSVTILIEDTTVFTSVPAVGAEYIVSAQVGPGTRAGRAFPPILRGLANGVVPNARLWPAIPAVGGSIQWLIPQNAGVISVCPQIVPDTFGTTLDPYDITATQRDAFGNVVKAWLPLIDIGFVPVVPAAVEMFIFNSSAAAIIRAAVEWGIDG